MTTRRKERLEGLAAVARQINGFSIPFRFRGLEFFASVNFSKQV